MRKQALFALILVFVLGVVYFSYRALIVEKVEKGMQTIRITTPLPSVGYFIEQIGGECVKVDALLKGDQDYHSLELTPTQIKALNNSQVFFTIGTPEEMPLVEKLRGSNVKVIDLSAGLTFLPFKEGVCSDSTDVQEDGWDPHVWLGISNMAILGENIATFLGELNPVNRDVFQQNLTFLQLRLQELWQRTEQVLVDYRGSCVVVLHASYGYFLQPFGIAQISLESFQKESSVKQLMQTLNKAKNSDARFIFVSPRQNPQYVESLVKQFGLKKIVFEPIFKDPFEEIDVVLQAISSSGEKQ